MFSSKSLWALATCVLVAFAACGCSDSEKAPTTLDLAPPAVPTDLAAVYTSDVVKVSWAPNVEDADFAGFKLTRLNNNYEFPLIDTPTNVTHYIDDNANMSGTYHYRVTAVDLAGNESAFAGVTVEITPPAPWYPETY